jgi:GNAT superfamily N-acetyltransferase
VFSIRYKEQTKELCKEELDFVFEAVQELKRYPDSEFDYGTHNRYIFCQEDLEYVGLLIYYTNSEGGIWLSKIYVKPHARRRGVASKMFDTLRLLGKTIDVGIYPLNEGSTQFFQFLGLEPVMTVYRKEPNENEVP